MPPRLCPNTISGKDLASPCYNSKCKYPHSWNEVSEAPSQFYTTIELDKWKHTRCAFFDRGKCSYPKKFCPFAHGESDLHAKCSFNVITPKEASSNKLTEEDIKVIEEYLNSKESDTDYLNKEASKILHEQKLKYIKETGQYPSYPRDTIHYITVRTYNGDTVVPVPEQKRFDQYSTYRELHEDISRTGDLAYAWYLKVDEVRLGLEKKIVELDTSIEFVI